LRSFRGTITGKAAQAQGENGGSARHDGVPGDLRFAVMP
jgi:hypothetical protein